MGERMVNKNIVIFGCDNTGKTTLAHDLVTVLDCQGEFVPSAGPGDLEYQEAYISKYLNKNGIKIFDRFAPIEESVCGTILRGENNFSDSAMFSLYMNKVDLFIFCYPGLLNVMNWGEREQMAGVKDNVVDLINGYNRIANWIIKNGMSLFEYNYCIPEHWEAIRKEVIKIAEEN